MIAFTCSVLSGRGFSYRRKSLARYLYHPMNILPAQVGPVQLWVTYLPTRDCGCGLAEVLIRILGESVSARRSIRNCDDPDSLIAPQRKRLFDRHRQLE